MMIVTPYATIIGPDAAPVAPVAPQAGPPTHDLKTWPQYFAQVWDGSKRFELRRDDRGFAVGDGLRLREWDPATSDYTGRMIYAVVRCIVRDVPPEFGLMPGFAILGILVWQLYEAVYPYGHPRHGCGREAVAP